MNDSTACPRCGSAIEPGAPQGLCPSCVLAAGFETQTEAGPESGSTANTLSVPSVAELAPHFPQLEILRQRGRGGMGWVFEARQRNLDRVVALKVLPPEIGREPAFAERFLREARALAKLNHPNIVAIFDFGQAGPYYYFVMEFVDGANLRELERSRRLSPEEAFAIVPKICEALQFAHDEGVVHRDIKPENILLDSKGRLKIADFGIAKIVGTQQDITLTGTQHTLGTLQYMAPEQIESPAKVDHRADIYALGVVFYEMLTGELPMGRFEPPSTKLEVDVRVDEVVLKSLERSPERRYQTAGAVKTDVETIARGVPPEEAFGGRGVPAPAPAAAKADRIAAAVFCLFVCVGVNMAAIVVFGIIAWLYSPLYRALLLIVLTLNCLAAFGAIRFSRAWGTTAAAAAMGVSLIIFMAMPSLFWVLLTLPLAASVLAIALPRDGNSEKAKGLVQAAPSVGRAFARAADWMVWLLVPLAFLAMGGRFDSWIPFEGPAFDAAKILVVAGCLGFLVWYFRGRKSREAPSPAKVLTSAAIEPPPVPAGSGAWSILGRAWTEWWGERAKWFTITVQSALVAAHLICLFAFFSTTIRSTWNDQGRREFTFATGAGEPWYKYETYPEPNTPFRSGVDVLSGSMLFLAVGFALYYVVWRIEKVRKPKAGFWSSPAAMALIWGVWAVCAVGLGTKLGNDALQDEAAGGGLFGGRMRKALALEDAAERQEALRNLAVDAASANDVRIAHRAIGEIRDGALRDDAAARSALALARLLDGESKARETAELIDSESLREETLARVADLSAVPGAPSISRSAERPENPSAQQEPESPQEAFVAAAARGDISKTIALLDGGVSVNDKNAQGQTALIQAVANGHRSLALTLILLGADITEKDANGMTAVMHAVKRADHAFLTLLPSLFQISYEQDAEKRKETLRGLPGVDKALLKDRDFDLVQFYSTYDALDQTNADGETPALIAARLGDWETFEMVGKTVDALRARSKDGRTASMHFAINGVAAPFEALEKSHLFGKAGAENGFVGTMIPFDIDQLAIADKEGKTALALAQEHGRDEIAGILSRHLESVIGGLTREIEHISGGGLTAGELARELNRSLSSFEGDEEAQRARLADEALRKRYELRSFAWQALGEKEKSVEDYRRSKRPAEGG